MPPKVAYFDCFAGVSGDMVLAALLDLGLPLGVLLEAWRAVGLEVEASVREVSRGGIRGKRLEMRFPSARIPPEEMARRISEASLPPRVVDLALKALGLLEEGEKAVHGTPRAHFHELADPDTLADVVGAAAGVEWFGFEEIVSSPVPLARGTVMTEHGPLPAPCPATLHILKGIPVAPSPLQMENVTPTGAALLKAISSSFGPVPEMVLEGIGHGAGSMDPPELPNLLRVMVGSRSEGVERLWILETDLDDLNPEVLPYLEEGLKEVGAKDVTVVPLRMKKGRVGVTVRCLVGEGEREAVLDVLFRESSTLGVRGWRIQRWTLQREVVEVETPLGPVKVKVGRRGPEVLNLAPEFESCKAIARRRGVPLKEVYRQALISSQRQFGVLTGRDKTALDKPDGGIGPSR